MQKRKKTHCLYICLLVSLVAQMAPAAPSSHGGHPPSVKSIPADQSLGWLINGNQRFIQNRLRSDGQSQKDIAKLTEGQAPHAIVLSCSDSRVPPEVIFDQKLGEIFVVRTAGEALGDNAVGSIEYAVEHLGSQLIVVMGHTSCGAVKAALGSLDGSTVGTPALDGLVKDMHPRLAQFKGKKPSSHVHVESWTNAHEVAKDLIKRSNLLRKKIQEGHLKIVTSLYDLETGKVSFHDKKSNQVKLRTPASQKTKSKNH